MSRQLAFFLVLLCVAAFWGLSFASGLQKETTKQGDCSFQAKKGDQVEVHYVGRLATGRPFDNSYSRGQPFQLKLGAGQVIKGWDEGIVGMCLGERRTLTIPPEMGYGSRGAGALIPPGATLVFKTELVGVNGQRVTGSEEDEEDK